MLNPSELRRQRLAHYEQVQSGEDQERARPSGPTRDPQDGHGAYERPPQQDNSEGDSEEPFGALWRVTDRSDPSTGLEAWFEDLVENPSFGCFGTIFGFFAFVAYMSMCSVRPRTYGLQYNAWTKRLNTERVYDPGRYLLGPWTRMIVFPASINNVEFTTSPIRPYMHRMSPILGRTREGMWLELHVSVQYKLNKDEIPDMYLALNMDYEDFFISSIRSALIRKAAQYEAPAFWQERQKVAEEMQKGVHDFLRTAWATCWGLQLIHIELPLGFENALIQTQIQKQNIVTFQNVQQATQIRAKTSVIESEYKKKVKILRAGGIANFTYIMMMAGARANQRTIDTEASTMKRVGNVLGLESQDLVVYQKNHAITRISEAMMLYGFDDNMSYILEMDHLLADDDEEL